MIIQKYQLREYAILDAAFTYEQVIESLTQPICWTTFIHSEIKPYFISKYFHW